MSFIVNWVEDKVAGYAKTGIQAGGTMAGNAVGGVGTLVEGAGRSAANGVSGGIGGVANYINGYGDSIKRSMSADGPVASANKTAVKAPGPAEKKPPNAPKALSSSQGAKKALPAPASKPGNQPARPKPAAASAAKPPNTAGVRPAGSVASKPGTAVSRPTSNSSKVGSSTSPNGKVTISAASKPKPAGARSAVKPSGPTSAPKDPLGIGNSASSSKGTRSGGANQKAPPRKSTPGDPLALGDLGKK